MTPSVSICVPTHNRAASLRSTLRALFGQTFQDFEIVVGDDASTDNTPEVVREFDDPRLRYVRHATNLGIYPNWNALITHARGRFVCIYHDHDTYLPTIVGRSVELLDRHPDMVFVHTGIVLVDKTGAPIDVFANEFDELTPGRVFQERVAETTRNTLCAATTMVRREAYAASGPFDPQYGLSADRHKWLQLAARGSVGYVAEPQALIIGRSPGDPTERFTLRDLLGNYRITEAALAATLDQTSAARWRTETRVRREVQRDLVVALLKAIMSGTANEIRDRLEIVSEAMTPTSARMARAATRWPLRPLLRLAAGRSYAKRLAARRARALAYCQASPTLRGYLPAGHDRANP